jgi:hypothetical protein
MLMVGLLTRLAALVSMLLSVVLMALFGWQGATCIDEWTMAACNLAMGTTLLLAGGSAYSVDNVLVRIRPALSGKPWFQWIGGSLPLPQNDRAFRTLALTLFAFVAVYNIGTYSYFRGSVVTPFHSGPVSATVHHLTMRDGKMSADGQVRFHVYLDGAHPKHRRTSSTRHCSAQTGRLSSIGMLLRCQNCLRVRSPMISPITGLPRVLTAFVRRWARQQRSRYHRSFIPMCPLGRLPLCG